MRSMGRVGPEFIQHQADFFYKVNVFPLAARAYVIDGIRHRKRGFHASLKRHVKRPYMVINMEPVTDVFSLAVDRKRLAFKGIEYHKGDELFRQLIGAVVI